MVKMDSSGNALKVACASCGAVNRVPVRRLPAVPRCGRCAAGLVLAEPFAADDGNFPALVRDAGVPLLVDFWAPWCGPCRAVAPELEVVARERAHRLLVAKMNSDENPVATTGFGIRSIPTLLLFRGGREVARQVGALRAADILRMVDGEVGQ